MNMFKWRETSDAQPRAKNGQPPHRTTGVAQSAWIQTCACGEIRRASGLLGIISPIASARTGAVSTRLLQNRRVMSRSSALSPSSALGSERSSDMPQIGQSPG